MKNYAIYNKNTGQIVQVCSAPTIESISHMIDNDHSALECTENLNNDQFYVDVETNTFVEFSVKPNQYCIWDWSVHAWIDPRTLQDYKDEKWTEIKNKRDSIINSPLTTPYGIFDADPNSRANIANSVLYLQTLEQQGTPGTVDWTLADNTMVTLDYEKMSEVGILLGQRTNQTYDIARALRLQIDSSTTAEEVESVTWPVS